MEPTELKKKLNLFRSSRVDPDFKRDIESFLALDARASRKLLEFFLGRDIPHRQVYQSELQELQKETELSENMVRDVASLITFILSQMARRDVTLKDIAEDLSTLGHTDNEIKPLENFLSSILEQHPDLKTRARVRTASNAVIETVTSLEFAVDARAVFDKDDNLLDMVPVLIVCMTLASDEESREVVFQMNMEKLEKMQELLAKQKVKLAALAKRFAE